MGVEGRSAGTAGLVALCSVFAPFRYAMPSPSEAVTAVLRRAVEEGLPHDALVERLLPVVYDEFREIAHAQRRRYDVGGMQTTALVHEAYLRLAGHPLVPDRAYVFAAAARAMRNVLVDHARRRRTAKRGGDDEVVGLPTATASGEAPSSADLDAAASRMLDVDAALERLAELDERAARVVECRYFGGLSFQETAAALGVSMPTTKRDWRRARAWLHHELADGWADDTGEAETTEGEATRPSDDAL